MIMMMVNEFTQIEIERANFGCDFDFNRKQQTRLLEGEYECFFKLHKPITFQVGNDDDDNDSDDGECCRDGDGDDDDYRDDEDDAMLIQALLQISKLVTCQVEI